MKNTNTKWKERMGKVLNFVKIKKALLTAYAVAFMVDLNTMSVGATGTTGTSPTTADDMWTNFVDFLTPWVQRIGGAIAFIGVISFAEGYFTDQADHKQKGIKGVIAGCMIFAIGLVSDLFLV